MCKYNELYRLAVAARIGELFDEVPASNAALPIPKGASESIVLLQRYPFLQSTQELTTRDLFEEPAGEAAEGGPGDNVDGLHDLYNCETQDARNFDPNAGQSLTSDTVSRSSWHGFDEGSGAGIPFEDTSHAGASVPNLHDNITATDPAYIMGFFDASLQTGFMGELQDQWLA